MKMRTIPEAAKELNRSESFLRRGVESGRWSVFQAGRRALVDVDVISSQLGPDRAGVDIKEISRQTGLSMNQIRCGIREGWIPYWVDRKRQARRSVVRSQ